MKKINLFTLILLIHMIVACNKDNNPITKEFGSGSITFSPKETKQSFSRSYSTNFENIHSIVVSITDNDGPLADYNKTEIPISKFDASSIAIDPIELNPGDYSISFFELRNINGFTEYATPLIGSELAEMVNYPLPINFTISSDNATNVTIEVINTLNRDASEFGYLELDIAEAAESETIVDYDGNEYRVIKIGNQWWMTENLRSIHYSDGRPIEYSWYNNESSYAEIYGALYDWASVIDASKTSNNTLNGIQGACPTGWKVPSDQDWKELELFVGMSEDEVKKTGYRLGAGGKLRALNDLWREGVAGTDEFGFSALPAGYYFSDMNEFIAVGTDAAFWTSTETSSALAYWRDIFHDQDLITRQGVSKNNRLSCRCIKAQ
ncbi:fibrobacter succinogenes major paralogous domain-containing protein [Reichenbachiella versicolor]|uniref:fibrobacter succinogenes major paralogous domain-containing protein n=1 Tax=Reichenbachiella versicolor TaxID=1821036 RepID=UPI000D6E8F6E|nr:fibrobacter succinogenes major paralogous domain-containing protein [Reichenbachiella versicolor]